MFFIPLNNRKLNSWIDQAINRPLPAQIAGDVIRSGIGTVPLAAGNMTIGYLRDKFSYEHVDEPISILTDTLIGMSIVTVGMILIGRNYTKKYPTIVNLLPWNRDCHEIGRLLGVLSLGAIKYEIINALALLIGRAIRGNENFYSVVLMSLGGGIIACALLVMVASLLQLVQPRWANSTFDLLEVADRPLPPVNDFSGCKLSWVLTTLCDCLVSNVEARQHFFTEGHPNIPVYAAIGPGFPAANQHQIAALPVPPSPAPAST